MWPREVEAALVAKEATEGTVTPPGQAAGGGDAAGCGGAVALRPGVSGCWANRWPSVQSYPPCRAVGVDRWSDAGG